MQFDVGTLLTTPTIWVFESMVAGHPGANAFFAHARSYHDETSPGCGEAGCVIAIFRNILNTYLLGDHARILHFFDEIAKLEHVPDIPEIREIIIGMGITGNPSETNASVQDIIDELKAMAQQAGFTMEIIDVKDLGLE